MCISIYIYLHYGYNIKLLVGLAKEVICSQSVSHVWLFVTPWTMAHQAPLSMGFFRQEYYSGNTTAISSSRKSSWPRDQTHVSCTAGGVFTTEPLGKPKGVIYLGYCNVFSFFFGNVHGSYTIYVREWQHGKSWHRVVKLGMEEYLTEYTHVVTESIYATCF